MSVLIASESASAGLWFLVEINFVPPFLLNIK